MLILLTLRSFSIRQLTPIYAFYSLFVITYIGSRIVASLFYKPFKRVDDFTPGVSFIIPVYNEEKVIERTIRHCFETDYPQDKLEVVVVNDGSTDSSWDKIESMKKLYPKLNAINLRVNKGKRMAMALAIAQAGGEIVIQLDSDSYLERNSLRNLVSAFVDEKMGGVSAHTDPENKDDNVLTKMQAAYYFWAFRVMKAAESSLGLVFCCSGCCSAYRKEYVLPLLNIWVNEKHLGVRTTYGDDRAITNLLIRNGYKTAYSSTAQAYTIVPNNIKTLLKQQKRWKQGWLIATVRIAFPIIKLDPYIAFTYIYPQMVVNLLSPLAAIYSIIYLTLINNRLPVIYFLGLALLYTFYVVYYSTFKKQDYSGLLRAASAGTDQTAAARIVDQIQRTAETEELTGSAILNSDTQTITTSDTTTKNELTISPALTSDTEAVPFKYDVNAFMRYRPYLYIWAFFNIILNAFIFPWAILTLRDIRWGTR